MRKTKFAAILSLCMTPAMFWSSESSAIPSWSRKYAISCSYCHSGFPTRNAMGDAFKNNGFRLPGGKEEIFIKQAQVKIGNPSWGDKFPNAIMPSDIPGYDALSVYVTGALVNYKQSTSTTQEILNWKGPADARILYGATIGDNLSFFGAFQGLATSVTTSGVRGYWTFSPGVNLSFGNSFSNFSGPGSTIGVSNVLPAPATGLELNFTKGDIGGFSIVAGVSSNTTAPNAAAATAATALNYKLDDLKYVRARYKLFGSGLLSGNGGTADGFTGVDNQVTIGGGLVSSRDNGTTTAGVATPVLTGNYNKETLVYGVDLSASHNGMVGGVAYSKDRDLNLRNFAADGGYYIYPWLFARVRYTDVAAGSTPTIPHNPYVDTTVSAYLRANVSIAAAYRAYTKKYNGDVVATANQNANTFTLTTSAAF